MISENDFENSLPSGQNEPVAIDNKHAYKKVVIKETILKEPSSLSAIDNKTVAIEKVIVKSESYIKPERDKINSLPQKEKKLEEAGVTRRKAYQVIYEALTSVKTIPYRDKEGNEQFRIEPDFEKNKWGTEMAIKMFGDAIERKEIEYDIGETTLARLKGLSVAELKARAAEILLGKNTSRLPVTDAETRTLV